MNEFYITAPILVIIISLFVVHQSYNILKSENKKLSKNEITLFTGILTAFFIIAISTIMLLTAYFM